MISLISTMCSIVSFQSSEIVRRSDQLQQNSPVFYVAGEVLDLGVEDPLITVSAQEQIGNYAHFCVEFVLLRPK